MEQGMPQACPRCGNMLVEKQLFCIRCGLSLEPYLSGVSDQPTTEQHPPAAPSHLFSQPAQPHYTIAPEASTPVQASLPGLFRLPSQEQDIRTPLPPSISQL